MGIITVLQLFNHLVKTHLHTLVLKCLVHAQPYTVIHIPVIVLWENYEG